MLPLGAGYRPARRQPVRKELHNRRMGCHGPAVTQKPRIEPRRSRAGQRDRRFAPSTRTSCPARGPARDTADTDGEGWCVVVVPAGALADFLADCRSDRPAKALSVAAAARWGGRLGRLFTQDAALRLLGAFAGTRPAVPAP